ncbi:LuxR C-terminal-related transcriptional regulator [Nocardioides sp. cx-169]|uniref:response regulator transcription factor n=1 Tax=Nocardioides sp. cx-169 TaxID=2899080 RepID=UPI001E3D380F|nr:LuxR C-terminal-related transcriptional regulator [Nocardioides sp. cx-169]MCD4534541.1 LuxR C-terminal-related transcriptional regulator [Nocardioides sp. cx-169]
MSSTESGTAPEGTEVPSTSTTNLSARESEIVALIVQGLSHQEIAETAFLSINSVKTYIRTAYRKMGVTRRSQAVGWAIQHGFAPEVPADDD